MFISSETGFNFRGVSLELCLVASSRSQSTAERTVLAPRLRGTIAGGVAGLLIGTFVLIYCVSFAALIFTGAVAPYLSQGIGLMLFTAIVTGSVVACTSSCPTAIAAPQKTTAAVLAALVPTMVAAMPAGMAADVKYAMVVSLVTINSVLSGVLFWLLGQLRLGRLGRYVPYPVVGGFLAGSGWLLVRGALRIVTGQGTAGPARWTVDMGAQVGLALLVGGLLWAVNHWWGSPLAFLALTLGGVGLFYSGLGLTDHSLAWAQTQGMLLGPFPSGGLWSAPPWAMVGQVHWPTLADHVARLPSLWLIDILALLLNLTGLELMGGRDLNLNRELQVAGVATLAAAAGCGTSGFHSLSLSTLGSRLGPGRRTAGLVAVGLCALVLLVGAGPLALVPKSVVSGLLIFLGLGFLFDWLILKRPTLSAVDYALVWAILLAIALHGVLAGVGCGLLAAVVIFVVDYSRLPPTRFPRTAATSPSHVERPPSQRHVLHQMGEQVLILPLEGVIFFGTAVQLVDAVQARIRQQAMLPLRFVVLDFAAVRGLDSSAVLSLARLRQQAGMAGVQLVFTGLDNPTRHRLHGWGLVQDGKVLHAAEESGEAGDAGGDGRGGGPDEGLPKKEDWAGLLLPMTASTLQDSDGPCLVFDELTRGIEWCEDQLLAASALRRQRFLPLPLQLEAFFSRPSRIAELMALLQLQTLEPGEMLFSQGEPYNGLYFLEAGQINILQQSPQGYRRVLRTHQAGIVIGEMGLYNQASRSASACAETTCRLYWLSSRAFESMERDQPALAAAFHRMVVQQLAERLRYQPPLAEPDDWGADRA